MKLLLIIFMLMLPNFSFAGLKVLPPEKGAYHGAYADFGPTEDQVTEQKIKDFQELSGKKMAWAYFSNHWLDGIIKFPNAAVAACKAMNVVPYIRLSPWSEMLQNQPDEVFSMQAILNGDFDPDLRTWAREARETKIAIMIEFGPEANGDWFPWNGKWNGGSKKDGYGDPQVADGPERFRDAYRHLIDLFREEKADNITWVLHLDTNGSPHSSWNDFKNYYPGDEYIDWIGLSVFGAQLPQNEWIYFPKTFKHFWPQIEILQTNKPIMISEFAVIESKSDATKKAKWITQALQSVSKGLFKQVKGITYWNSPGWLKDKKANMMIDSSPEALKAYRTEISQDFWLTDVLISSPSDP